jgi:Nucleotidyl transferase AbiEii toxin, Type IV TA system
MLKIFTPRLDVLPDPQRKLWPELAGTPDHFILYGGTAIALHLGHRQSVDFDFFSPMTFEPLSLLKAVPYLKDATVRKSALNDLSVTVDRGGPVQLSFFGNFDLGQVAEPELAEGPRIKVASLIDLAGLKAAVVTQRRSRTTWTSTPCSLSPAYRWPTCSPPEQLFMGANLVLCSRSKPSRTTPTRVWFGFPWMSATDSAPQCKRPIRQDCLH